MLKEKENVLTVVHVWYQHVVFEEIMLETARNRLYEIRVVAGAKEGRTTETHIAHGLKNVSLFLLVCLAIAKARPVVFILYSPKFAQGTEQIRSDELERRKVQVEQSENAGQDGRRPARQAIVVAHDRVGNGFRNLVFSITHRDGYSLLCGE